MRYRDEPYSRGCGTSSTSAGRHEVDHISLSTETLSDSSVVVRLLVSEPTSSVASESDDGSSALSTVESTAAKRTVAVSGTGASDELSTLATLERTRLRGDEVDNVGLVSEPLGNGGVVVRLGVSEPTPTVTGESDDGTGALASPEGTTTKGAFCVRGTGAGDELGTSGTCGGSCTTVVLYPRSQNELFRSGKRSR